MNDKLRELAGAHAIVREAAEVLQMVVDSGVKLPPNWRGPLLDELSGIAYLLMDAEGDAGAVGYVCPDDKITFYVSDGWSRRVPPGTDLYTHPQPVRSGVVSDEQAHSALMVFRRAGWEGGRSHPEVAMRAALTHFAKSLPAVDGVPDAIVELDECRRRGWNDSAPAYRAGWNDCRNAAIDAAIKSQGESNV